jgi:hypothetical protein
MHDNRYVFNCVRIYFAGSGSNFPDEEDPDTVISTGPILQLNRIWFHADWDPNRWFINKFPKTIEEPSRARRSVSGPINQA